MTPRYLIILSQCHFRRSKVTLWKSALLVTDLYILYGKAVEEILTSHNDCFLPVGMS